MKEKASRQRKQKFVTDKGKYVPDCFEEQQQHTGHRWDERDALPLSKGDPFANLKRFKHASKKKEEKEEEQSPNAKALLRGDGKW